MKKRGIKLAAIAVAAVFALTLAGCGDGGETVSVQSVGDIAGIGSTSAADRFPGIVVAGQTESIKLDEGMTVKERYVEEGQQVNPGDVLFAYDTEAAQLTLEQTRLEIQSMRNSIDDANAQIKDLTAQRAAAPESEKLSYTLEIQTLETNIRETEYNINLKQTELTRQEEAVNQAEVKSTIQGIVSDISESGTDSSGNPLPYMTITETGSMRVKGTLNEMNRNLLYEGVPVTIRSRVDDSYWTGTLSTINWDGGDLGTNSNGMPSDEMSSTTKYPFYVDIDSSEGLLMGQHVYIQAGLPGEDGEDSALKLPEYYINDADGESWVWAESSSGKLEKRSVTLGEYFAETGEYAVTDGLTPEDYIAFPEDGFKEGMKTARVSESDFADPNADIDIPIPEDGSDMSIPEENGVQAVPEGDGEIQYGDGSVSNAVSDASIAEG